MSASELAAVIETRPALDVTADLTVAVGDSELSVESYTDRITVEAPSLSALVGAAQGVAAGAEPAGALERAGDLGALLAAADLTVVLRVRGSEVGRLGTDLNALRYRDLSVRPRGLIGAIL